MINGLAKAVALYLAPILALTSLVLSILVFLAPNVALHMQVSLLQVKPSGDGPTVLMGVLGSCSRSARSAPVNCTTPTLNPVYDLSVLPGSAPSLLNAPTTATPAFIAVALALTIMFFFLFTVITLRHKLGKFGAMVDKPMTQRISAWIGVLGFMIGITAFLILRMWFGKAADDFNSSIALEGNGKSSMSASTGNGFIMVWVAYAFYAVPLVCSMAKLHAASSLGK